MTDAFGEGPGPLPRYIYKFRIRGNLIQHRKDALRFRQQAAIEIGFELQQRVVDSQPVVRHAPHDQIDVFLRAGSFFPRPRTVPRHPCR